MRYRQRAVLSVDSECVGYVLGHEIMLIADAEAAIYVEGNTDGCALASARPAAGVGDHIMRTREVMGT